MSTNCDCICSVRFECQLVTQTIALMEYTKELESLLTGFKSGWVCNGCSLLAVDFCEA